MNEPRHVERLAALGPAYQPRTRHLDAQGRPRFTNALIHELSPYLLQHAHNPVDWRPWGPAAFAEAAARDVPVFLSVGYSACHWCHVMEHESFEDEEVASVLNAAYVPVKVDREERPDVDAVFMEFVQLTTGSGGWPMSVWLTPTQRPLFGGTYFPARDGDRGPHRGLLTLLRALSGAWKDPRFQAQADEALSLLGRPVEGGADLDAVEALEAHAEGLLERFDPQWGGFGPPPKFPRPGALGALLRWWRHSEAPAALSAVRTTLDRMHLGGLYDQVGGGFARYSTDRQWRVPHFEKMLYDNAQLVGAYLDGWQATGEPRYAAVARDVLRYLQREMSDPAGGFYAATDADSADEAGADGTSHSHEGLFFVWTPETLGAALDASDAAWVQGRFGVTPRGNFEGRSVLWLREPLDAHEAERWSRVREILWAARARRPAPGLDDKVVTSWNGLAIQAFARAGRVLGEPGYVARAVEAADFVWGALWDGQRLARTWRGGEVGSAPGVLEDYTALIAGHLALLEATGSPHWLDRALALQRVLDAHFAAPEGGYHRTPDDGEALLFRERPLQDGAEPSGNAQAAHNLLALYALTAEPAHRAAAAATIQLAAGLMERAPQAASCMLSALDALRAGPRTLVIVHPPGASAAPMVAAAALQFDPDRRTVVGSEGSPLMLFTDRPTRDERPTAYLCQGHSCQPPVTTAAALAELLS